MKAILGKVKRQIKIWIWGRCPNCGAIGTWKECNDTGLLLSFNSWWMKCSKCGCKGKVHHCGKGD